MGGCRRGGGGIACPKRPARAIPDRWLDCWCSISARRRSARSLPNISGMLGATVIKVESPAGDTVRRGVPTMQRHEHHLPGQQPDQVRHRAGPEVGRGPPAGEAADRARRCADRELPQQRSDGPPRARLRRVEGDQSRAGVRVVVGLRRRWAARKHAQQRMAKRGIQRLHERDRAPRAAPANSRAGPPTSIGTGQWSTPSRLLAALYRRAQGGRGGYYLTSQLGSSLYGGVTRLAEVARRPRALRAARRGVAVHRSRRRVSLRQDGYVAVTAADEACWSSTVQRASAVRPSAAIRRLPANQARLERRDALTDAAGAAIRGRNEPRSGARRSPRPTCACAPVPLGMTLLEALDSHPQVRARNLVRRVPSHYGTLASQAPHWEFEKTPAVDRLRARRCRASIRRLVLDHLEDKAALMGVLAEARRQQVLEAV